MVSERDFHHCKTKAQWLKLFGKWEGDSVVWAGKGWYTQNGHLSHYMAARNAVAPHVISDQLDYMLSHADGRRYTSKRAYERAVKAKGCEIVGDMEPSSYLGKRPDPTRNIEMDVKRTLQELASR